MCGFRWVKSTFSGSRGRSRGKPVLYHFINILVVTGMNKNEQVCMLPPVWERKAGDQGLTLFFLLTWSCGTVWGKEPLSTATWCVQGLASGAAVFTTWLTPHLLFSPHINSPILRTPTGWSRIQISSVTKLWHWVMYILRDCPCFRHHLKVSSHHLLDSEGYNLEFPDLTPSMFDTLLGCLIHLGKHNLF